MTQQLFSVQAFASVGRITGITWQLFFVFKTKRECLVLS